MIPGFEHGFRLLNLGNPGEKRQNKAMLMQHPWTGKKKGGHKL